MVNNKEYTIDEAFNEPCVACIGYFDSVHIGHQKLIQETIKLAKKYKCKSYVICFDPDPDEIIDNKKYKHVLNYQDRLQILCSYGIDSVIVINFNKELMKLTPKQFIDNYLNRLNIKTLICGLDYSFGYLGKGNVQTLVKYGKFEVRTIKDVKYKKIKVSTTRIKQAILECDFSLVCELLGRSYILPLKVSKCSKNKQKWLIKARLADKYIIIPKDGTKIDSFCVKDGYIYYESNVEAKRNSNTYITINYE